MGEQKNQNGQEQDINQLLKVRREKLADLQERGKDPFQITKYNQTHHSSDVKALYEEHEAKILAGRAPLNTDGMDEAQAKEALASRLEGKTVVKEIYVPGKIINLIVK